MSKTVTDLVKKLDDKDLELDAEVVRLDTHEDRLRNAILQLVEKQVVEACNYDEAINLAVTSLIDRIKSEELTTQELLSVISTLANKKVDLMSTTLEPFKPTPNGVSLLLPPIKERDRTDDFKEGLNSMSKEDLATIDNIFRAINC